MPDFKEIEADLRDKDQKTADLRAQFKEQAQLILQKITCAMNENWERDFIFDFQYAGDAKSTLIFRNGLGVYMEPQDTLIFKLSDRRAWSNNLPFGPYKKKIGYIEFNHVNDRWDATLLNKNKNKTVTLFTNVTAGLDDPSLPERAITSLVRAKIDGKLKYIIK